MRVKNYGGLSRCTSQLLRYRLFILAAATIFASSRESRGVPHLEVDGDNHSIADNSTTAMLANFTDFGMIKQGTTQTRDYFIRNLGTASLYLEPPIFTGPFSLVSSFPAIVPESSSVKFSVGVDTSTVGTYTGSISFANNDPSSNPFNFALAANVFPRGIQVYYNGIAFNDDDNRSDSPYFADFGRAAMGINAHS